jgi:hypothetical protein
VLDEVLELRGGWADVVHHVLETQLQETAAAAAAAEEQQLRSIRLSTRGRTLSLVVQR